MKKENIKILAGAAMLVVIAVLLLGRDKDIPQCYIDRDECIVSGIQLTAEPTPIITMQETVFRVRVQDLSLVPEGTALALHLFMPGMDMGVNRFKLQPIDKGLYSGRVVVPGCPAGKKLWRAVVLDVSARELAEFYFEVQ